MNDFIRIATILLILLCFLDFSLTMYGLTLGVPEANPVIRKYLKNHFDPIGLAILMMIKVLIPAMLGFCIYTFEYFGWHKKHPYIKKASGITLIVTNEIMMYFVFRWIGLFGGAYNAF